jgi:hypothetical protein
MLKAIGNAVHWAFAQAQVPQLDPDEIMVCGATLNETQ